MGNSSGSRDRWPVWAVVVLLVTGTVLAPVIVGGQSESSGGRIVTIEQTGDAIITTVNDTTYIWQSEQYTARATFQINTNEDQYSVCLHENRSDSEPRELDCRSKRVGNGSTATVTLTGANATETGERTLYFQLRPTFGRDVPTLDSRTIRQHVISKEGDEDTDGLSNKFEVKKAKNENWSKTAFLVSDIDQDGLDDGKEVNELNTDPTDNDSDDDGLLDGYENTLGTDPLEADSDSDGISDYEEVHKWNSDPRNPNDPETSSSTTTTVGQETTPSDGISWMQLLLFALVGVGLVGGAVLVLRARTDDDSDPTPEPAETSEPDEPQPPEPPADDGEILTDEGRVLHLLHDNRGRMKQTDIVDETGWSKSKVSRLLSRMEDRGDINRLRVGRGNIVYLDGSKPSGARSPHEEDSYS